MSLIKSKTQIEAMREAGKIHQAVIKTLVSHAAIGISTHELNLLAEREILAAGAKASFKGYNGFPASICTSINHQVVHGIPSAKVFLKSGDLLKLDLGVYYREVHADAGLTVAIGEVSKLGRHLMEVTRNAFFAGLEGIKAGDKVNLIGKQLQTYAEVAGFSVVRDLIGHGVGTKLHEPPEVPNFYRANQQDLLIEGMTLAVEPMLNAGSCHIKMEDDQWTISTADGALSAYFEHTILITGDGYEILT
jgi:methionyl aminopeptidase